ncbi:hypothetical protein KUTeg_014979 [Tegillarca granosa]|uniref:Uncharacterized protein n=1 Tax=Tegillarca granosa TaxID=220873 RepID=A0ABQ9ETF5_TEGGR|nr:hypothetical protein KUTeg_014979 [Tegillarca granosa]
MSFRFTKRVTSSGRTMTITTTNPCVAPREIKPAPKLSEADLFQDFRFKGYPNVGNDFIFILFLQALFKLSPNIFFLNLQNLLDSKLPRFTEKKIREREDINEFLKQKQFEREMKERERKREQREAFKMLQETNEFGKPGAGAPNNLNDHRKQKFTEEDLSKRRTPPRYQDQFAPAFTNEEINSFRKKFLSICVFCSLQDQDMARQRVDSRNRDTYRFPPNEKEVYARQIEADVQNRTIRDQSKKIDEMKGDLEMLKHDTGYRGPSPHRAGPDSFAQMQSQNFGEKVWEDMAPRRTVNVFL